MWAFLNAYFEYRKDPALAVRSLVEQRQFGSAFLGYAVAALCWVCFFWMGSALSAWGVLWRFLFFWLLEISVGYLWASLSGLMLNFFSSSNGPTALFIALGLSGFVQGILLCFALIAGAMPDLNTVMFLALVVTLILRFAFAVLNVSRAVQIGIKKAIGALCFVLVPMVVTAVLGLGTLVLLIRLVV